MNKSLKRSLTGLPRYLWSRCRPSSAELVQRREALWYEHYLREGMTVFDVGAHVGVYTELFSKQVGPTGQVHAFEPVACAFAQLKARFEHGNRPNIVMNKLALGESVEPVTIHVYDSEHLSFSTRAVRKGGKNGVQVQPVSREVVDSTTLDEYCDKKKINRIDLLKIDVEGVEYQVLLGAKRMLKENRVQRCVFEFGQTTADMGNKPSAIRQYLRECGYALSNMMETDALFPHRWLFGNLCYSMLVARPASQS